MEQETPTGVSQENQKETTRTVRRITTHVFLKFEVALKQLILLDSNENAISQLESFVKCLLMVNFLNSHLNFKTRRYSLFSNLLKQPCFGDYLISLPLKVRSRHFCFKMFQYNLNYLKNDYD